MDLDVELSLASLQGDAGNDTINLIGGGFTFNSSSINGNDGNDVIQTVLFDPDGPGGDPAIAVSAASLTGTNFIGGGSGDDTLDFTNATGLGLPGFELTGGSGFDKILGSQADDTLLGGAGSDTLTGGLGIDLLEGGNGNDLINVQGGDDVVGGLGSDRYAADGAAATYFIDTISESAATTSGKVATFDVYSTPGSFVTPNSSELNIEAVTDTLAAGPYVGPALIPTVTPIVGLTATTFDELKTELDALGKLGSSTATIQGYTFTAPIDGAAKNYLWINDSQSAYTSSDLMFQTATLGQITAASIII
jgi:Ca2+-binding RTX toxin-like protein